jgi:eukaryotic-like serine/threonine-protein kinase
LRRDFGHAPPGMADDETEITQPHAPLHEDTQAHEPVVPPTGPPGPPAAPPPPVAGGPPPPPDARVPPRLLADVWPWLAALGVLAVAGLLVWLFVLNNDSSKGTLVPAVVGMQQQQAIAKLTGDGFNVRAIVGPSAKPAGIVASQKPGGGSRLDKGQTVVLNVSNGHAVGAGTTTAAQTTATATTATTTAGQTTTTAATASVPDVTGQDAASGAGQIEAAGFVAETDPVSASGTPGSIVQEDPAAGGQAQPGSVVRLGVAVGSSRPAQQVPNVVGQKAGAARAALLDAKLTVKTEDRKGPGKNAGVVLSQSPAAGQSEPAYTQVTIVVGS